MESARNCVWAKLGSWPYWPAKITEPPSALTKRAKNKVCVVFFGTKNYGFINSRNIVDYSSNRKDLVGKSKTTSFKNAVDRIEEYISNPIVFGDNAVVKSIKGKVRIKMESDDNIEPRIELETIEDNENREAKKETEENRTLLEEHIKLKAQISDMFYENQKNKETVASLETEIKSSYDQLNIVKADNKELLKKVRETHTKIQIEMQKNTESTAVWQTEKKLLTNEMNNLKAENEALSKNAVQMQSQLKFVTSEKNHLAAVAKQLRKGIDSTKINDQKEMNESDDSKENSGDNSFGVEHLIKHRKKNRKTQFLVRWEDSWVDEKKLNCPKLLKKYYDLNNLK